ncbi:hypothetical protein FB468_1193 [Leucobacter komagatae]|uniref:Uncharacterized protein n=1 Tax=Leucobacter komagatae TaxID=55969 RepID=A0A542Y534_9MICO|nr:hypothetical protein [Leucobacter komagatae]TQL43178.1 hypothetical protein FB468_1193 [Leucobacter komagatae]
MTNARVRKHPLAGSGPIVDRARAALLRTATEFGDVVASDQTSVTARTPDGLEVTLSYEGGNFVFSRVYNLTLSVALPAESDVPTGLKLSHRARSGPQFVRAGSGAGTSAHTSVGQPGAGGALAARLTALNSSVGDRLRGVDLVAATVSGPRTSRTLTLTPMGGSYVWVLIPPVFKATAFPAGEPERLLDIVRALRTWSPLSV